ncbi:MAG TPA: DNA internalization-related competence protein ComEC/Rec2 [Sulfuricaulis sp.]|nr:DNA internalization-related competence protein ComEC/Rec2 [Sulfuricaulis sp.]
MAFLGGVLLVQQLAALPSLWWALLLPPLLWLARRRPWWFIPVFFVAGVVWVSLRAGLILQDRLPPELEGRDLLVEGRIDDIPKSTGFGQRFELEVTRAGLDGAPVRVPRRILLNSRDRDFQPRAGETWRLLVRLKRPHGYQNPGGFDYEAHLFRDRIRARGYVRDDIAPQRLHPKPAWYDIDRLRQDLGDRIRARLPGNEHAGIIVALANGDGRGLAEEQWQVLRRTGTLHLVAISGLHISLIAGVVFFLARWLWALPGTTVLRLPAPQFGAICALLAATFYAALAGFVVPTQRALIMLGVAMAGVLLRRRFPPSQLLAVAGLAVLVYDPLSVMAAGFWLSFAAVAVILFFMHGDRRHMPLAWKWGYIQWAIALGMLPLMLVMFQQLSLVGPLANMLAVPVFDLLLVPLTLLGALALGAAPGVAGYLFGFAAWLLHWLWQALAWLAEPAFSQWTQPVPAWWTLIGAVVGVLLLLAPRGWPARWTGAVWLLPLFLVRPPLPAAGEVWFTLLDVGQGLSAVVRTRGHTLLFDAGPRFGDFDTGKAVVEPYLRAVGVRRLDAFIASHGDIDHVGGAESVLRLLPVQRVLSSVPEKVPQAQPCRAGQTWNWDGVEFAMLGPDDYAGTRRRNDASCVLQVRSRHGNILLPADIEAGTEKKLVQRWGGRLRSEILVAPHHGSKTSSTPAFIDAVAPRHVLFPVGYRNRYRHAHPDVVRRYAERGVSLHDSPTTGALEFRLHAGGLNAAAYRVRQRRYWYAD